MTARPAATFIHAFLLSSANLEREMMRAWWARTTSSSRLFDRYPPSHGDPFQVFTDKIRRHLRQLDIFATDFRRRAGFWEIAVRCQGKPRWWYRLSDVLKDPPRY